MLLVEGVVRECWLLSRRGSEQTPEAEDGQLSIVVVDVAGRATSIAAMVTVVVFFFFFLVGAKSRPVRGTAAGSAALWACVNLLGLISGSGLGSVEAGMAEPFGGVRVIFGLGGTVSNWKVQARSEEVDGCGWVGSGCGTAPM